MFKDTANLYGTVYIAASIKRNGSPNSSNPNFVTFLNRSLLRLNTIVSQPRIQSLTETVTGQDDEIQALTQSLGDLQGDYDSLQSSYDELRAESEQQYQEQQTQILELQAQIESLQGSMENLEEIVETQETENEDIAHTGAPSLRLNLTKELFQDAHGSPKAILKTSALGSVDAFQ